MGRGSLRLFLIKCYSLGAGLRKVKQEVETKQMEIGTRFLIMIAMLPGNLLLG